MSLPANFSDAEFLQDGIRRMWNKRVQKYFSDVTEDDDKNFNTDRAQLKRLCMHRENDTEGMTNLRITAFSDIRSANLEGWISHSADEENEQELRPSQFMDTHNRPLITLKFSGDNSSTTAKNPVRGSISFRLVDCVNYDDETSDKVVTKTKLLTIANKIKDEFATPIYTFNKGKERYSYVDPVKGYNGSAMLFYSLEEAEKLFKKLLAIQGHTYQPDRLNRNERPHKNSITDNQSTVKAYNNKTKKAKNYRRIGKVFFRWAYADVGLNEVITLVDTTGYRRKALIRL
jgi:hypothetical protein